MNKTEIKIIPTPKSATFCEGSCTLNKSILADYEPFRKYVSVFLDAAARMYDTEFCEGTGGVVLAYDAEIKPGAYKMKAEGETLKVSASDEEGILYGIASALLYIDVNEKEEISVRSVEIEDYGHKPYRGLMFSLDAWYPMFAIYRYVDICFLYKVKYLHIHFGDDTYYTLPSEKYPGLNKPGRYFTKEDIKNLCEYARLRGVTIIPEVEAPGHTKILNKMYPEVFKCKLVGEEVQTVSKLGTVITGENLVCAGSEKSINAMYDLIDETCELFADFPYIHIGGDEANIQSWEGCEHCKKYMQENGIEDVYELYSDYVGRVAKRVIANGKTPIVWEGFPEKGMHRVPKETIVIQWESHYNTAEALLGAGYKLINASWKPLYIVNHYVENWGPFEIMGWNVHSWQHWWPKSDAYLNPVHIQPTDEVLGAEVCVWGVSYERAVNRVIDNLAALSERTWTVERVCSEKEMHLKLIDVCKKVGQLIQMR